MAAVIYFKFKSALKEDSVQFDGALISVGELKALIANKKGLGGDASSELLLSDARSKEEYRDDSKLLPKNSSVLVRRAPAVRAQALHSTPAQQEPASVSVDPPRPSAAPPALSPSRAVLGLHPSSYQRDEDFGGDLYAARPQAPRMATNIKERALHDMLATKREDWQRNMSAGTRARGRGRGRGRGRDQRPPYYRCRRWGVATLSRIALPLVTLLFDKRIRVPLDTPM